MSPDSGRGDEAPPTQADHVLTVEAEINRQTQAAGVSAASMGRKQQVVDEVKRQIQDANKLKMQRQRQDNSATDIQPDSLQTAATESALDAKVSSILLSFLLERQISCQVRSNEFRVCVVLCCV